MRTVVEKMKRLTGGILEPDRLYNQVRRSDCGAIASFVGTVRGRNRGREVLHIEYSAYETMAEEVIESIEAEIREKYPGIRVAQAHRTGRVEVGEPSVAIAVASPHRRAALRACSELIEALKARVPIWKKEYYRDGSAWIETKTEPGAATPTTDGKEST